MAGGTRALYSSSPFRHQEGMPAQNKGKAFDKHVSVVGKVALCQGLREPASNNHYVSLSEMKLSVVRGVSGGLIPKQLGNQKKSDPVGYLENTYLVTKELFSREGEPGFKMKECCQTGLSSR